MNRNQYFAISWFFFILMFILIGILSFSQSIEGFTSAISERTVSPTDVYFQVRNAIFDVLIYLSFPLFILFQILAWLEPKKK